MLAIFASLNQSRHDSTSEPTRIARPGDIILCVRATLGKTNWARREYCLGRGVAALRAKPSSLDPGYLWHWLATQGLALEGKARGSTFRQVTRSAVESLRIPLPPLPEQRRIAAILDKADAVRRKRQQTLDLADQFLRSAFLDMFGDRASHGWAAATVEEISAPGAGSIRTGPFGSQLLHSEFVSEGIAVLGIDNVVENGFHWAQRRYITQAKYEELKRYTVLPGDVLISIMGTCGRCAIVPADIPPAINTKHLCCITLDQRRCLPTFLHGYFLSHPVARQYLLRASKGAIMSGLNMQIIKALPVLLPPIKLQQQYAGAVQRCASLKGRLGDLLEQQDELFRSVRQRLFSGGIGGEE